MPRRASAASGICGAAAIAKSSTRFASERSTKRSRIDASSLVLCVLESGNFQEGRIRSRNQAALPDQLQVGFVPDEPHSLCDGSRPGTNLKLTGTVECDETYVGRASPATPELADGGVAQKRPPYSCAVERQGQIRRRVIADVTRATIQMAIKEEVEQTSPSGHGRVHGL